MIKEQRVFYLNRALGVEKSVLFQNYFFIIIIIHITVVMYNCSGHFNIMVYIYKVILIDFGSLIIGFLGA